MNSFFKCIKTICNTQRWPCTVKELQLVEANDCLQYQDKLIFLCYLFIRVYSKKGESNVSEQAKCNKHLDPIMKCFEQACANVSPRLRIKALIDLIKSGCITQLEFHPGCDAAQHWIKFVYETLYFVPEQKHLLNDLVFHVYEILSEFCPKYMKWFANDMVTRVYNFQADLLLLLGAGDKSAEIPVNAARWLDSEIIMQTYRNGDTIQFQKSLITTVQAANLYIENNSLPMGFEIGNVTIGEFFSPEEENYIQQVYTLSGMTNGVEYMEKNYDQASVGGFVEKMCTMIIKSNKYRLKYRETLPIAIFCHRLSLKFDLFNVTKCYSEYTLYTVLSRSKLNDDQISKILELEPFFIGAAIFNERFGSVTLFERGLLRLSTRVDFETFSDYCMGNKAMAYGVRNIAHRLIEYSRPEVYTDIIDVEQLWAMLFKLAQHFVDPLCSFSEAGWVKYLVDDMLLNSMKKNSKVPKTMQITQEIVGLLALRREFDSGKYLIEYFNWLMNRLDKEPETDISLAHELRLVTLTADKLVNSDKELIFFDSIVNKLEKISKSVSPTNHQIYNECLYLTAIIDLCTSLSTILTTNQCVKIIDTYLIYYLNNKRAPLAMHVPSFAAFNLATNLRYKPLEVVQVLIDGLSDVNLKRVQVEIISKSLAYNYQLLDSDTQDALRQEQWVADMCEQWQNTINEAIVPTCDYEPLVKILEDPANEVNKRFNSVIEVPNYSQHVINFS